MREPEKNLGAPEHPRVELAALEETDRQSALERFHLLQPHLEAGIPLSEVARGAGISYRTVSGNPRPGRSLEIHRFRRPILHRA